ncbi:hypothetical protein J1N35_029649 [Gossypium stocksii]|uniref:Uncharacterized protein n=1 Tax=Gossypium stocksii TaxID=47602 RepID=A0A9D3UZ79_9ROSI|nr:hypothetical protein J1N35_029649 [Gossypium stocksii]
MGSTVNPPPMTLKVSQNQGHPPHIGARSRRQSFICQQTSHCITPTKDVPKITPAIACCLMFNVANIHAEDQWVSPRRLDLAENCEGITFNNSIKEAKR